MPEVQRGRGAGRPTMDDVAARAGVSRGTVSRVLSGARHVSAAAAAAVRAAVRDTGYVVNQQARSLASRRGQSVAFVLAVPRERLFEDPNLTLLLDECTEAFARHGMTVLVAFAGPGEPDRLRRHLDSGVVAGAVLASAQLDTPVIGEIMDRGLPLVSCGKPIGHPRLASYVTVDDREGARQLTAHLRATGRRHIATITGPLDTAGGVERLAGYRDVAGDVADELVAHGDYTRLGGERAMRRLLERAPYLDAVFAASDLMAVGAVAALHRAGRRVPADVAVGGFDDSHVAAQAEPSLTTVRQPWGRISAELARQLICLLDGGEPAAVLLAPRLVVRDSA